MLTKLTRAELYVRERIANGSGPIHAASLAQLRFNLPMCEYRRLASYARDVATIAAN